MLDFLSPTTVGFGLAVAIGFLVGLEREWADDKPIGLRSFTLIGAAGGLAALMSTGAGPWVLAAGLLAVGAILVAHQLRHDPDDGDAGTTTLLAALAVYLIGAACVAGYQTQGAIAGGVTTLILAWKQPLHGLVDRIDRREFDAVLRFVLITLVILPLLPNDTYGPYDVVNPFQAWVLVVLIVGLNLAGYVAFRVFRSDAGAVVGGILGGLISSTATTVSFSTLTKRTPELSASAALIILLASSIIYARVALELLAVAPDLLPHAAGPIGVFALVMLVAAGAMLPAVRRRKVELPDQGNPARMQVALTFAALYVVIIVSVAAAREHLGNDAVYVVALISGLTDVDAMTLSAGQLFSRGELDAEVAWRAIFIATLANLAFKIGAACVLGAPQLRLRIASLGGITLAVGIALLVFWP